MRGSRFTQPARSEALPTLGSSQPLSLPTSACSTLGPSELLSCFGVGATRLQSRPQLLKVGAGTGGVDAPLSLAATVPSRAFAAMSASALGGASGSSPLAAQRADRQQDDRDKGLRGRRAIASGHVARGAPGGSACRRRARHRCRQHYHRARQGPNGPHRLSAGRLRGAGLAASRAAANAAARTHAREAALRRAAEGLLGGGDRWHPDRLG